MKDLSAHARLALLLPLLLLAPAGPLAARDAVALAKQIDSLLKATYKAGEPGATVIVTREGRTLFRAAYGLANVELGVAMKPEMVLRIGSVTKQFTSAAVMQLVQQGRVSLEDEITRFLPDFPTRGKRVTLEHLLTHTSGIKSYTGMPEFWKTAALDAPVAELIASFKDQPSDFDPGERWAYNNSGYVLLGAIIEKVTGRSYAEHMRAAVFEPLKLRSTAYGDTGPIMPGRVAGYAREGATLVNAAYLGMSKPFAAGGLVSNVDDLAAWDAALEGEALLRAASKQRMWTPYRLANGELTSYGYGWQIWDYEAHPVQSHGGGINGFACSVLRMPRDRVYVALLTNRAYEPGPDALARRIAALAIGEPIAEPVAVALDPKLLESYAGVYRIDESTTRVITREGGRLYSRRGDAPRAEIFPESESRFFFKDSLARLTFERDAAGAVTAVTLTDGPRRETARRAAEKPDGPGKRLP